MSEEEKMTIYVKSGLSRGKAAAAAVHAALLATDAHPGTPVIVLGANNGDIEVRSTVVRDHGKTEVEPGTMTAGTDFAPKPKPLPSYEDVMKTLAEAACDEPEFGWLSDNETARLVNDGHEIEITTYGGDTARVDLHHLAEVVRAIVEDDR